LSDGYIRRRGDDRFQIQRYIGRDPVTNRKRYAYETVHGDWEDAALRNLEWGVELRAGAAVDPGPSRRTLLADYMMVWLDGHASLRVSPRTLEGYRGNVERYIIPLLGGLRLSQLTPARVRAFEARLLAEGGVRVRGLSPNTVGHVHRVLSMALGEAVRSGVLASNPAGGVRPPSMVRKEFMSLDWDELHRFLSSISAPFLRSFVLLAVQTGLRRSEVLGIRWGDVEWAASRLSVRRALIRMRAGALDVRPPKSRRARVVALMPESVSLLGALREESMEAGLPHGPFDYVFCGPGGAPVDPDSVTQSFRRAASRAGLEGFRFHDLRHTHASLLMSENVHPKVVSERLGHSDVVITLNLYSHVLPNVQEEAAERFGEAWRERSPDGGTSG
jgi:integrase